MSYDLIEAAQEGDIEKVKQCINNGADVDAKDGDGKTTLMYAAENGNIEVVKYLVENGADINARKNKDGKTTLMYAAENGYLNIVKLLVENGADVNVKDNYNDTALKKAVYNGHADIVKYLLDIGTAVDKNTPIDYAIRVHLVNDVNKCLHYAAKVGLVDYVKHFIEKGANVNAKDCGVTVLSREITEGYPDVVKLLVENGADINTKDDYGKTPLMYAAENGNLNIIKFLVEKGADIKAKDKDDKTALDLVHKTGHSDVVQYLESLTIEQLFGVKDMNLSTMMKEIKKVYYHAPKKFYTNYAFTTAIDNENQSITIQLHKLYSDNWVFKEDTTNPFLTNFFILLPSNVFGFIVLSHPDIICNNYFIPCGYAGRLNFIGFHNLKKRNASLKNLCTIYLNSNLKKKIKIKEIEDFFDEQYFNNADVEEKKAIFILKEKIKNK